jgi:hypothetical protein
MENSVLWYYFRSRRILIIYKTMLRDHSQNNNSLKTIVLIQIIRRSHNYSRRPIPTLTIVSDSRILSEASPARSSNFSNPFLEGIFGLIWVKNWGTQSSGCLITEIECSPVRNLPIKQKRGLRPKLRRFLTSIPSCGPTDCLLLR